MLHFETIFEEVSFSFSSIQLFVKKNSIKSTKIMLETEQHSKAKNRNVNPKYNFTQLNHIFTHVQCVLETF